MSKYLHGIHDVDGAELMRGKPGWILITEAIGSNPHDHSGRDYSQWTRQGYSVLCRLNNGYHPAGTIPHSNDYDNFARRCSNFVRNTPGITVAIIGNEPNHANERPNGELILPAQYAKCFDLCYEQIKKNVSDVQVCTAAIAPWDATTTYPENPIGDWVLYYIDVLRAIRKTDAISLHSYTHGADPVLITDNSTMNPPFEDRHYNFRAYVDFMINTPAEYQHLPVYITETDQVNAWDNRNIGWIQEAYEEIDFWNHTVQNQKIFCLCIYRTNKDDQWSIANKDQVKADFRQAVERGYQTPDGQAPPSEIGDGDGDTDVLPIVDGSRLIDPELLARGVVFDFVKVPVGMGYWKIIRAVHLNEQEADAVGPDHHILGTIQRDGHEVADIPFTVSWPTGHTTIVSKSPQITIDYNYDFPMTSSLNEFGITVATGDPSDTAYEIGMGAHGNPSVHTSTWIDWEWTIREESLPIPIPPRPEPVPPLIPVILFNPLPGSVITRHFYQNPEDYARFGLIGHNGTDLAGVDEGTSVKCICDGVVAWVGFDESYGNYIRVRHHQDYMSCYSFYAHLSALPTVLVNDVVKGGDVIGLVGSTGNSTGPHLHLEIRLMEIGDHEGDYREGVTGMGKGRVDPETFFVERGLRLGRGSSYGPGRKE